MLMCLPQLTKVPPSGNWKTAKRQTSGRPCLSPNLVSGPHAGVGPNSKMFEPEQALDRIETDITWRSRSSDLPSSVPSSSPSPLSDDTAHRPAAVEPRSRRYCDCRGGATTGVVPQARQPWWHRSCHPPAAPMPPFIGHIGVRSAVRPCVNGGV